MVSSFSPLPWRLNRSTISKRRACSCDTDLPTIRLNALCRGTEVGPANTGHTETDMQNCGRGTGEDIVGQVLHDPAAIMEGGGALVTVLLEPHHVVMSWSCTSRSTRWSTMHRSMRRSASSAETSRAKRRCAISPAVRTRYLSIMCPFDV